MDDNAPILPDDSAPDAPLLADFDADLAGVTPTAPASAGDGLEAVYDVPVRVQAVLGRARMPVGDLLRLRIGTIIELDRRVGEPVDIFVNNRLIARGEVVLIDGALGVTLTEIVRSER